MTTVHQFAAGVQPRARAPRGGITIDGRSYRGGSFVPRPRPRPPAPVALEVAGVAYTATRAVIHPEVGSVAYRVDRADSGASYHVHRDISGEVRCDCPDFEFRRAGTGEPCKHGRALVAAGLVGPSAPRSADLPHRPDEFDAPGPAPIEALGGPPVHGEPAGPPAEDDAYHAGFSLGIEGDRAEPPRGYTDGEARAFRAGNASGIREFEGELDAWYAATRAGTPDPGPDWGGDELSYSRALSGHPA